jgi:hypothetical protein
MPIARRFGGVRRGWSRPVKPSDLILDMAEMPQIIRLKARPLPTSAPVFGCADRTPFGFARHKIARPVSCQFITLYVN